MKLVIACDSYKGSASAAEAARALAEGAARVYPQARIETIPIADGGEGTVDAFLSAVPGRRLWAEVSGPMGEPVKAAHAMLEDGTAVLEMCAASGLTLVPPERRNPLLATSYGTGQLIAAALDAGCARVILGIGGSATNDGGAGMAQALGVKLLDGAGRPLPPGGGSLGRLERVDCSQMDRRARETPILIASDVTNPLCGPEGASAVYGPQKGATPAMVRTLDANLARFAALAAAATGRDVGDTPGAGAAGGLGAGLLLFCRAELRSGIDALLDAADFDRRAADADLVLTGEGRIDGQSAYGKAPVGVARRVKALGDIPVIAVAGGVGPGAEAVYACGIDALCSIAPGPISLEEAMAEGPALLADAAERVMRLARALGRR